MVNMVTDLMLAPGLWSHGLIDHIFNPIDKDTIMAIPLSILEKIVKSGYHILLAEKIRKIGFLFFWWKALWKLKILPKPALDCNATDILLAIFGACPRDSFEEVCVLLWLLWSERNKVFHGGSRQDSMFLSDQILVPHDQTNISGAAESARTSCSASSGVGLKFNIAMLLFGWLRNKWIQVVDKTRAQIKSMVK
ncbi:hypothetical protein PanWU01x14_022040 [Parasponia andersonii]|uniref:Uncharacterized protein n=1 Tax=Parasponia andersonii TaxID=3476 RepID=A0A2P5DY51_PARAD|nr:hypothetical protein PanWU01x14_022040 [Parasponia andersonii]